MEEPFRRSAKYYDARYVKILDYAKQCDYLETIFARHGLGEGLSILDIACGTGTHCLELARRGHEMVGIDISPKMIEHAKNKVSAHENGPGATFVVQDMRSLHVDGGYDVAICMFGGFGYLMTDDDLSRFFSSLSKHLKSSGLFLFEFWNIGGLKDSPYKTWYKIVLENGILYNISESNFDHERSILEISMEYIIVSDGSLVESFVERHDMRIYSLAEMRGVLTTNGFDLLEAFDGRAQPLFTPPSKDTFRIFAVARSRL